MRFWKTMFWSISVNNTPFNICSDIWFSYKIFHTLSSDIASSSVVIPLSSHTFLARSLSNLFLAGRRVIYLVPSGLILTFHSQLSPPFGTLGSPGMGGGGIVGGGGGWKTAGDLFWWFCCCCWRCYNEQGKLETGTKKMRH